MKNTIDDADYIIDWSYFNIIFQYVANPSYSHSIVNKQLFSFVIIRLVASICLNTMKNTMLRNFLKKFQLCNWATRPAELKIRLVGK